MKVLGIIPARAGSKGIKNKNTEFLSIMPLYRWVLDEAILSLCFDHIVISTNITEIINSGDSEYVQVRPKKLCQGESASIKKVIRYVLGHNPGFDIFAILQPTSPFIRIEDIEKCLNKFYDNEIDSAQTIRKVKHLDHAYNQRLYKDGYVSFVFPECRKDTTKQDQPEHYALGNLIMTRTEYFLRTNDFFGRSAGVEIPWKYGVDIDYPDDLELAECMYSGGMI